MRIASTAPPPSVEDTNGDGVYELFTNDNDYTPSYADGTRYTTEWHWSGSDYVGVECTVTPANGTSRT